MKNLVLHITLPKGLALVDGRKLFQDVTFDVISRLDPYYASVDQVRLAAGPMAKKLPDMTVACQIYQSSQEADLICPTAVLPSDSVQAKRFYGSRNQWVTAHAARDLVLNVNSLIGRAGAHVLANFSVSRSPDNDDQVGMKGRIQELEDSIKFYTPTLRSQGKTMPGGRPRSGMAAKGVYDWTERTPARTWMNTGLGANATSWDFGSPTGGRGKPVKFYAAPMFSPPLINLRAGVFQGTYPLVVVTAFPTSV